jgi:hypothetical protein
MTNNSLETNPETNMYLDSNYLSLGDEINPEFISTAIHINFLHYEELLLKAKIRKINELFNF